MVDMLKELWALQRVTFDAATTEHTEWLQALWHEFFPATAFQRISPLWKTIGFQVGTYAVRCTAVVCNAHMIRATIQLRIFAAQACWGCIVLPTACAYTATQSCR